MKIEELELWLKNIEKESLKYKIILEFFHETKEEEIKDCILVLPISIKKIIGNEEGIYYNEFVEVPTCINKSHVDNSIKNIKFKSVSNYPINLVSNTPLSLVATVT